jgi:hypothetical protein
MRKKMMIQDCSRLRLIEEVWHDGEVRCIWFQKVVWIAWQAVDGCFKRKTKIVAI